jgi:anthranilate/para-aminobenzoate synthase component I
MERLPRPTQGKNGTPGGDPALKSVHEQPVAWQTEPTGDLTPWDAFLALDDGEPAILLDSARPNARIGRYSIIGVAPRAVWQARGSECVLEEHGSRREYGAEPVAELRRLLGVHRSATTTDRDTHGLPFACGGLGYVSYEARHSFERLPQTAQDDLGLPHWYWLFCDETVVFDSVAGTVTAFVRGDTNEASARQSAKELLGRVHHLPLKPPAPFSASDEIGSSFSKPAFEDAVRRVLEYIAAGDVYQVNLSQRLDVEVTGDARTLYDELRRVNPSPFAAFLRGRRADGEQFELVSSSPERLVSLHNGHAETRPIAGTRPRGVDSDDDDRLRAELILNEKERAEHVMLVDLERNDLGRVCRYGTVRVDELMVLEHYSHVNHIVSNVVGGIKEGKDALDLLSAMFPGGTITGCPKIRCMQIIDEVEPVARHAYTGAIGYISDSGAMDTNIVIRTAIVTGGKAYVPVGAGIVADSDPAREFYETMDKAEALLLALRAVSEADSR